MIKQINHFTLNSGHNRKSEKTDINKELFFKLNSLFQESLKDGGVAMELQGKNFIVDSTLEEGCGLTTLYIIFGSDKIPLLTTAYSDESYTAYDMLVDVYKKFYPNAKVLPIRPQLPYIADLIFPSIALMPDVATWTGDFTKCMGWIAIAGPDVIK